MRWFLMGCVVTSLLVSAAAVHAGEDAERLLGGVVSGLLGAPQQPVQNPQAIYTAQERERLASLLQSGEYATSRQGEPVDLFVYGIPLTHNDHVYTAKPVPPTQRR